MRTRTLLFKQTIAIFLSALISFNCKKETVIHQTGNSTKNNDENVLLLKTIAQQLAGTYTVVGTKKNYQGPASDSILVSTIDLSSTSPKTLVPLDSNHLVCDYANLGPSGWHYIITVHTGSHRIQVRDDGLVISGAILAFKVYDKHYNAKNKRFYLKTGYVSSVKNESVVEETLTKQ